MEISTLKEFVKKAPNRPGVYVFKSAGPATAGWGGDLYIGKASSIKRRLSSYTKTIDHRIRQMIERAHRVEYKETDSDIEALILESQLIKQKRPQFNVMLRDDKQYFFVGFSKDEFPRIFLTHQPHNLSRSLASGEIGPFTDGAALKATLKFLRSIFPYCTCKQKHHNFCLNYHIGKCIGICCLREQQIPNLKLRAESLKQYRENIKALREILSGRKASLVKEFKRKMESSGQQHHFQAAIELRNKIEKLERIFHNAQIIKESEIMKEHRSGLQSLLKLKQPIIRIEGYDISNIQGEHATGSMVAFFQDQPDKNYYRKFNIHSVQGSNDTAMLREVLKRRLRHPEWPFPDLIVIDGGKSQVNAALKTLSEMAISIPVIGISKDERHKGHQIIACLPAGRLPTRFKVILLSKLSTADRNLLLAIDAEAHRFAISHYRHLHRKAL